MKTNVITFTALAFLCLAFTFTTDLFTRIGCDKEDAFNVVADNFLYQALNVPGCNGVYKSIAESDRAEVVDMLYKFIRETVSTETFKQRYRENHEANKPQEPVKESPVKMDEAQMQALKVLEEQLNSPYLDESQKAEMKKTIDEMKAMFSSADMKEQMGQVDEAAGREAEEKFRKDMETYKTELAEWEKMKDINYMLKKRLKAFLELTADIDFNAKLVPYGKKMKFENPAYESKSHYWKACFRCGPTAIKQARIKANEWLKELN